jgi:hypothetical protein
MYEWIITKSGNEAWNSVLNKSINIDVCNKCKMNIDTDSPVFMGWGRSFCSKSCRTEYETKFVKAMLDII